MDEVYKGLLKLINDTLVADFGELPECQNLGCAARGTPYCDVLGEHKAPGVCAGYMFGEANDEP